ncbi:unnamed protein product [Spodoptera littoralis]|uniref:Leucine-rich repeat-containing protein 74B n=1 Tax=Spodoptera littoralis TaxID=7109 RepID=A0A9P0IFK5_SPOLI|nr:unnamed protein product [Spodoptera littoralis]CAH1645930.1 unnamed protein product [Spodoptera littoralis]
MEEESETNEDLDLVFVTQEEQESSVEQPPEEWSSVEIAILEENKKKVLYKEGLYSPGSGELCAKYITVSNSSILRHLYYNYPPVADPGINEALLKAEQETIYSDDGQALYLHLCNEINICPVRLFYNSLLKSEIDLRYYGVEEKGVRPMALALQFNKHVHRFNLTGNFLNDDACYHLGHMLSYNCTLNEIVLDGCRIGASGILRLGRNLHINRTLMFLSLENNYLGDIGGTHFADQLLNTTVNRVNLSKNQLGRLTATALAEVFEWSNRLTHLNLSWNCFYHIPSTIKMLEQLALSTCLEELSLSFNSLGGDRVANAIKNILLIPTLTLLDLSNNNFQKEAIDTIISNLLSARKLITFNLSFNPMTPQDAFNVLQLMLKPRIKINQLLLENVCVSKPFVALLTRVKKRKNRKNFVCTFGTILQNWTIVEPDGRDLILKRVQYLGMSKKTQVDTAMYLLSLAKEYSKPITTKEFQERTDADHVGLDESLVMGLAEIFPGPRTAKYRTINLNLIVEYILRLWPDKKLPPTPPPEPEPVIEEAPPPPPPTKKGKGKANK